jgi:hypothetical protein
MNIFIDQQTIDIGQDSENLVDILSAVTQESIENDRAISAVTVDGVDFTEQLANNTPYVHVGRAREIQFHTIGEADICRKFLDNASAFIHSLSDIVKEIATRFRSDDPKETSEQYLQFIQIYQDFLHTVLYIRDFLKKSESESTIDETAFEEQLSTSADLFDRIIACQKSRDWVLLADLLEYEMTGMLQRWETLLPTVH